MDIIISLLKVILLYFIIIIAYKLMGKRKISELSIMDFVVFLVITNLIVLSLPSSNGSFLYMAILLSALIAIQISMTYFSSRIPTIRYLFHTKPSLIIVNGKLNFKEMFQRQYNLNTLLLELREKSIKRIEDIEYATLEHNGKLAIFEKKNDDLPIPLILDGKVEYLTLKLLHKDYGWLNKLLIKQQVTLDKIFYAFFKQGKLYIIKKD